MDAEEQLKKEEERLQRAMSRGGSRANLAPAKKETPKPVEPTPAPAAAASGEEPQWKRRQREEREATERRLAEEKQRKEQTKTVKTEPTQVRSSPRAQPAPAAATSAVPEGIASQDEVLSYEEREKRRRDDWKKRTNPYEWAMEDPDRRLHLLPDLLAAKEKEEARIRGAESISGSSSGRVPTTSARAPEQKGQPASQPSPSYTSSTPAPYADSGEVPDELLNSLADAELNAKRATFMVNVDQVHESMRGDAFDFRSLAALVRELQQLAPLAASAHPEREEESSAFLNEPTRELLLKAKSYKDDHDAEKQRELVESMERWAAGAKKILE